MTLIKHIKLQSVRFTLFALLLVAAPLSKYPSIAMPLFNFPSFRIGLYPVLALLFVLASLPSVVKSLPQLFKQSRAILISMLVLASVGLIGLTSALYMARSALLVASILLLIGLLLTAWWYVAYELPISKYKQLLKLILIAGCIYGAISIVQFIFAGFGHETFGLLCANCSSQVFGFPRISGFAAEPQFHANALLIYFFVGLGAFYKARSRLALSSTVLALVGIGLTFSRGAFLALGLGVTLFFVLLRVQGQVRLKTVLRDAMMFVLACVVVAGLFVAAASYRYRGTPDIAYKTFRSMVDQLSGGLIKLPASDAEAGNFIPSGLVEASGQDRLEAARLAVRAWDYDLRTRALGVGAGNLGSFVVKHIEGNAPSNLTVYIFYVLILSELGIVGLGAFLALHISILKNYARRYWRHKDTAIYTSLLCLATAFLIQYLFFGSYINTPYIWLWFGILLGLGTKTGKSAIISNTHEE